MYIKNQTTSAEERCSISMTGNCTEKDRLLYLTNAAINIVFCAPTMAINLILFAAVWRTSSLRTPSNILICALAGTDFCVGLTAQPVYGALLYSTIASFPISVKCVLQVLSRILANVFVGMSFLTFTAISVDKLLMVHLHLRYDSLVTNKRTTCILVVLFGISAALAVTKLVEVKDYVIKVACVMSACFVIAFISYVEIYRTVLRHQKHIHFQAMAVVGDTSHFDNSSDINNSSSNNNNNNNSIIINNNSVLELARFKKRTFSMMSIYGVFFVFCLPYICFMVLLQILGSHCLILELKNIAVTLIFLNSLVNPVMVCWRMREIRHAMKRLVCLTSTCSSNN